MKTKHEATKLERHAWIFCVPASVDIKCLLLESKLSPRKKCKMILTLLNEPGREKTCLMSFANNKGADQPVVSV